MGANQSSVSEPERDIVHIENEINFDNINDLIGDKYMIKNVTCFFDLFMLIHNINYLKTDFELKKKINKFIHDTYYDYDTFYDYRELFGFTLSNVMFYHKLHDYTELNAIMTEIDDFARNTFESNSTENDESVRAASTDDYESMRTDVVEYARQRLMDVDVDNNDLEIAIRLFVQEF
jgi:hypothetical protein